MRKNWLFVLLVLTVAMFAACGGNSEKTAVLSEEQKMEIQTLCNARDQWLTLHSGDAVNRIAISNRDGKTVLYAAKFIKNSSGYAAQWRSFQLDNGVLEEFDDQNSEKTNLYLYNKGVGLNGNASESEIKTALEEAYQAYLSK